MITIQEALNLVDQQEVDPIPDKLPLAQALDCYLCDPITSPIDLPSFDNSAMDGYAVCGTMKSFEIIGEVAAGNSSACKLAEGQAMRIFTGGKVPENTSAVIMQEKAKVQGKNLLIEDAVEIGKNIRKKGTEITKGRVVFDDGHRVNPATIGVLSSLGLADVLAYQQPSIHIIATGNELVEPGEEKATGEIYESNSQMLATALQDHGFYCGGRKKIKDDLHAITEGISEDLNQCDVLLITGGISVGDYDYVEEALEKNGVEQIFYKVFQKPGKPLFFGRKGDQFIFALPGNPASSLTCFYVYVLPLLQKMAGGDGDGLLRINLPISHKYEVKFDRPAFLKANIENHHITILDGQGSSMIHSMAMGNVLAFVEGPITYKEGDLVNCLLI